MQDNGYSQMHRVAAQKARRSRVRTKVAEVPAFAPMFVVIGVISLLAAALYTVQSF